MQVRNLTFVGFLTWLIVAVPHTMWMTLTYGIDSPRVIGWFVALTAFLVCFWFATRDSCMGTIKTSLIVAESVLALLLIAINPGGFVPVLLVMIAGQLGQFPLQVSIAWISAMSIILGLLSWEAANDTLIKVAAYFAFQLFAVFAVRIAFEERDARLALAEANAELRVATGLLDMSSRAEERLRIARDLHDLIGHHLTALSLNLEVASHLASDEAREQIEKSKSLTKLLLSDVRDVVSRLREDDPIDLATAIRSLQDVVPTPAIRVQTGTLDVHDPAVAETALRVVQEIVTNAVRHASAKHLWLDVASTDGSLTIDARDDGIGTDRVQFGNGLAGMRERVTQAKGTMEVQSMRGKGFEVRVRLPLEGAAA